jgi:hypothetical protein
MKIRARLAVPETRYQMYLKVIPFNMVLMQLGCLDDAEAARLLGMKTPKTIRSARTGGAVSDEFMANTLAAFKLNRARIAQLGIPITLDTFFEEGTRAEREHAAELAEVA